MGQEMILVAVGGPWRCPRSPFRGEITKGAAKTMCNQIAIFRLQDQGQKCRPQKKGLCICGACGGGETRRDGFPAPSADGDDPHRDFLGSFSTSLGFNGSREDLKADNRGTPDWLLSRQRRQKQTSPQNKTCSPSHSSIKEM